MEILAPAGSILALKAAINGGANAVYLGLGEHNARIKSADFNEQNLSEWISYAHLFGVKVYVTLNTAVKDEEFPRVISLAKTAAESGADALIVSDLGLVKILSENTNIPLHLSTQAGVQNALDVKALTGLRIKRVILSREALLSDVQEIKKYVDEVEIFVQGAVCVSFSGGCLLGSKIYGQSGNRGVCNQACRLTYSAFDENGRKLKTGKLLSPKDLSYGEKIKELCSYGVDSVKIEGRLKRPLYVYAAVKYYRDLLDGKDTSDDLDRLSESFNRGFFDGYTLCKSKPLINVKTSSHIGVAVGKVLSTYFKNGFKYARVTSDYQISKGDGFKILRQGFEVGGSDVTSVRMENGASIIPVSDGVQTGDDLRLTTNAKAVFAAESVKNTLPVTLTIEGNVGLPLLVTAKSGEVCVKKQTHSFLQKSNSSDNAAILEKLSKVGGTDFCIEKVSDKTAGAVFVPTAEINELRRELLSDLREAIISMRTPRYTFSETLPQTESEKKKTGVVFEISDLTYGKQYDAATAFVLSPDLLDVNVIFDFVKSVGKRRCYLRLPRIIRGEELPRLAQLIKDVGGLGVYTDNLYGVTLARELNRPFIVGFGANVFNGFSAKLFTDADLVAASVENPANGSLVFRYGKVSLMNFAHCPFSVAYGYDCASCKNKDVLYYENADGRYMITRRRSVGCDFTLYEDKPTLYPKQTDKTLFYRWIGLSEEEMKEMTNIVMEDCRE